MRRDAPQSCMQSMCSSKFPYTRLFPVSLAALGASLALLPALLAAGLWPAALASAALGGLSAAFLVMARVAGRWQIEAEQQLQEERRARCDATMLHRATVEALAMAIEAKDTPSYEHPRDVQYMAAALARAAGLPEPDIQAVETAALLHDIGMLAVPPHIVAKSGRLTREELEKVRTHPSLGADILRHVPFPRPVAPLIESHHERWDGAGYPAGLAGEAIPIGARIIAIADRFCALMAHRPHRRAKTREEALGVLRQEEGTEFDPHLVQTFIALLPTIEEEWGRVVDSQSGRRVGDSRVHSRRREPPEAASQVLEHIAIAHREFHDLFEQVRLEASTDRLTGLLNSRGLALAAEQTLARAARLVEPVALLMMDVDNLKAINDTFGHAAGDRVLREVARVLRSELRPTDLCGRWAGDEFVVVLTGCSLGDAERKALDLQARLISRPIPTTELGPSFVRVSVGFAASPQHGRTLEALFAVADERMYVDKQQNREDRSPLSGTGGVVH